MSEARMRHFHESIDGWFDFEDVYEKAVAEAEPGAVFVEVGTWLGKSLSFLAVEIFNSGKAIDLYCVDTWLGDKNNSAQRRYLSENGTNIFEKFLATMRTHNILPMIKPLRMESTHAAGLFQDDSLDFVFIDADHSYNAVSSDIESWLLKVKSGGILAGHDYVDYYPDVQRAVNERLPRARTMGHSFWYRKP